MQAPAQRDEAAMIAAILGGQPELFHELVRPYERNVYAMALSFLRNEADAEDAAQEAFLKAFRNLASFRGDAKLGTWLVSIVLNEARSRMRRNKIAPMDSLDQLTDPNENEHIAPALLRDWREVPSEALERSELRQLIRDAITTLPPIYREVFLLRDVEELSTDEAAQLLHLSIPALKVRLHRARLMMQKVLAPQLKHIHPNQKRRWIPWS